MPEQIKKHSRIVPDNATIVLYDGIAIGNNEYYLLEVEEEFGTVTLKKGILGRYKMTHLSYGSGSFENGIVEIGGKQYLLFGGRDYNAQIDHAKVKVGGEIYTLSIGKETHFLVISELVSTVEDSHIDRATLELYNEKGENITASYDLSGGDIR